jgi:hypothetical protein
MANQWPLFMVKWLLDPYLRFDLVLPGHSSRTHQPKYSPFSLRICARFNYTREGQDQCAPLTLSASFPLLDIGRKIVGQLGNISLIQTTCIDQFEEVGTASVFALVKSWLRAGLSIFSDSGAICVHQNLPERTRARHARSVHNSEEHTNCDYSPSHIGHFYRSHCAI